MQPKEIYIAGKANSDATDVTEMAADLERRGHHINLKWWKLPAYGKPYCDYSEASTRHAADMERAAYESDIFILNPGEKTLGAAVELGSAIASTRRKRAKEILIIQPASERQPVLYVHPAVTTVNGLAQIRLRGWY